MNTNEEWSRVLNIESIDEIVQKLKEFFGDKKFSIAHLITGNGPTFNLVNSYTLIPGEKNFIVNQVKETGYVRITILTLQGSFGIDTMPTFDSRKLIFPTLSIKNDQLTVLHVLNENLMSHQVFGIESPEKKDGGCYAFGELDIDCKLCFSGVYEKCKGDWRLLPKEELLVKVSSNEVEVYNMEFEDGPKAKPIKVGQLEKVVLLKITAI